MYHRQQNTLYPQRWQILRRENFCIICLKFCYVLPLYHKLKTFPLLTLKCMNYFHIFLGQPKVVVTLIGNFLMIKIIILALCRIYDAYKMHLRVIGCRKLQEIGYFNPQALMG